MAFVVVLGVAAIALVVVAVLVIVFSRSSDGAGASAVSSAGPSVGSSEAGEGRTLALRFEGEEDIDFARALVERRGGHCGAHIGEVAVDLMRLAPTATHFYFGSTVSALRSDLPGGVILALDVEPMSGDGDDLAAVITALRNLGTPRHAHLAVATVHTDGRPLQAVDDDERPGHRRCAYCRHAFVVSEFQCPNCGGRVQER